LNPPAAEVAQRAVPAVLSAMEQSNWLHFRNFGSWSYEGGAITRGLWEISQTFNDTDLEKFLHHHLNYFIESPHEFGHRILHNESLTYNGTSMFLPWLYSIGDNIGLFPIVYADRLKYSTMPSLFSPEQDSYILSETVEKYIYGYPWHLPDGTISRPITWLSEGFLEPHSTGVWVDDMFMGTAVLVEWAKLTRDSHSLSYAVQQVLGMASYLENSDGLLHHGYNYWTGHLSCCLWARGNGWAFTALTGVLTAAEEIGTVEGIEDVLLLYKRQAAALMEIQSEDGLWGNILDNNSSFLETSASAMFLAGLSKGVRNGWLDSVARAHVEKAWKALSKTITEDGIMTGIIGGTGIQNTETDYAPDNTDFNEASPGVGAVLMALAEVGKLQQEHTSSSIALFG